jgi:hypothetical protein
MSKNDFVQIKDHGLRIHLKELTPELEAALLAETKIQADDLTNYIIKEHLTGGTTENKLKVRSGSFRRLTIPIKPSTYSKKMRAGTQFAGAGARVHVGPPSQVTTIKPITSKYLAIPIGDALSASGAPRYSSPRAVPGLIPITSRKGNLLLVQATEGGINPLFLLLKQTEVPARIHPIPIMKKRIRGIADAYRDRIADVLKETL